jgi:hypothetical protein
MPGQGIGGLAVRSRPPRVFDWSHPLARVAADLCRSHPAPRPAPVDGSPCGWCFERATRDHFRREMDPAFDPASLPLASARVSRHFSPGHPLAEVARRHCRAHVPTSPVGPVACSACWTRAIIDDERVVFEHDLPRDLAANPMLDDSVVEDQAGSSRQPPRSWPPVVALTLVPTYVRPRAGRLVVLVPSGLAGEVA